jgi:hypothetical protein
MKKGDDISSYPIIPPWYPQFWAMPLKLLEARVLKKLLSAAVWCYHWRWIKKQMHGATWFKFGELHTCRYITKCWCGFHQEIGISQEMIGISPSKDGDNFRGFNTADFGCSLLILCCKTPSFGDGIISWSVIYYIEIYNLYPYVSSCLFVFKV